MTDTRALIIKHTYPKVVGWAAVVVFTFFCVMSWWAGGVGIALVHLIFALLGGYVLLTAGSMQVDPDSIRYLLPFRSHQIRWNEVRYIEIDRESWSMVFVGETKKLAVHGPSVWTGKDKRDAAILISKQMDKYGIELRPTQKAMFRLSRNTRVRV